MLGAIVNRVTLQLRRSKWPSQGCREADKLWAEGSEGKFESPVARMRKSNCSEGLKVASAGHSREVVASNSSNESQSPSQ